MIARSGMTSITLLLVALVALVGLVGLVGAAPVLAQPDEPQQDEPQGPLQVEIRDSDFEEDGSSSLVVSVSGPAAPPELDASDFVVTEDGEAIEDLEVEGLTASGPGRIVTALSIDTSASIEGQPLEDVKDAAQGLVRTLTDLDIQLGVHEWSTVWESRSTPTTDADVLFDAIDAVQVEPEGGRPGRRGTALYDAVIRSVEALANEDDDTVTSLILLTDGRDRNSESTREEAIATAREAGIPVTVVAFDVSDSAQDDQGDAEDPADAGQDEQGDAEDPDDPEDDEGFASARQIAEQTGGRFLEAAQTTPGEIAEVFDEVGADVASQYQVDYRADRVGEDELVVAVEVEAGEASDRSEIIRPNPRSRAAEDPPPPSASLFDAGVLGTPVALFGIVGVAFLAVLLLLMTVLVPRGNPAVSRNLRQGLIMVTRAPADAPRVSGLSASSIGRRALDLVDAVPTPEGYDDRLQERIDRAGWQLRASEFNALRIGIAAAAGAWVWALTGRALYGLIAIIAGAVGPSLYLLNAQERRQARFMELLPDTLQLLSGTLRAGYGSLQAIDTVVKESDAPMSTEFQRVLTEVRLGLPLEDSLAMMAERIDDDDFRWVVVAMNIQRRVGGNLAELLETVAGTLRGREQVRRQVKVLSAEGRLSAVVLIALPFLIVAYLLVANPTYLRPLFVDPLGIAMVGGAVALLALGILWMRKLIRIDV